jgi:AraC-like DNA-binding protein
MLDLRTTLPSRSSLTFSSNASTIASTRQSIKHEIEDFAERNESVETQVPGLRMGVIRSPMPYTPFLYEASLCVCVRGVKHVLLGNEELTYDQNHLFLTCIGLPTLISVPGASTKSPYVALQLILDLKLANELMTEMDLNGVERQLTPPGYTVSPLTAPLLDAVHRLVLLNKSPADIPFLHTGLHREILYRLLTQPIGGRLRQTVRADSSSSRVARALGWIRENYARKITIGELAKIAGMAAPTLFRHFHEITNLSPLQYQKLLRLQQARRLLLDAESDAAGAAFAVGYESVSQFNREYRRLFGAPPATHIRTIQRNNRPSAIAI